MTKGAVLLSFDVEEFDLPRERGVEITLGDGINVSKVGLIRILKIIERQDIVATFFCTANFVEAEPELIRRISESGHEIACHGVDHFNPQASDIEVSKKKIEKALEKKIQGYRVPRMQAIDYKAMKSLGYLYDSSVNPAFIPGRYNHLNVPRRPYQKNGIIEIPTSVATVMRVPLFWLALHLFPQKLYLNLCKMSLKKSGYLATYFHPWEFTDLRKYPCVPKYIQYNSGKKLEKKLEKLIINLKKAGYQFKTYASYAKID